MANFEALIRNALASQTDHSEPVREAIYNSSRNALERIIQSNRSLTVEGAMAQKAELEDAIARIEAEYAPPPPAEPENAADRFYVSETDPLYELQQILSDGSPAPQPASEQTPPSPPDLTVHGDGAVDEVSTDLSVSPASPASESTQTRPAPAQNEDGFEVEAAHEPVDNGEATTHQLADGEVSPLGDDDYTLDTRMPDGFRQRRRKQRIGLWVIVIVAILALLVWIGYQIFVGIQNGTLIGFEKGANTNPNAISNELNTEGYITVLRPSDLSSLVVAGRGTAELVTQQNTQMIRIRSLRDPARREQPAEPLLLRFKPGVLQRIRDKRVTVEIYAKSGTNEQAQFAVSCQFANGSDCGRKRFVAGVQPQASVFEFEFASVRNLNADYFIAFNTDTTSNAAITGEGDLLDIVYVRLKTGEAN